MSDAAIDRVKSELSRTFDRTHADLERIEILAAGLAAFSTPIPPYEPRFHHLRRRNLGSSCVERLRRRGSITCDDAISPRTSCRRSKNRGPDFPHFGRECRPETSLRRPPIRLH